MNSLAKVAYTSSKTLRRATTFLKKIQEDVGHEKFDVIIDDGSHVPWHQIFTLEFLFDELLSEGGVYIIEDVETSYWDKPGVEIYDTKIPNGGFGKHGNALEKLKGIVDVLNRGYFLDPDFSVLNNRVDHEISHITFSQNCVIIHKKMKSVWKQADELIHNYVSRDKLDDSRREYLESKERTRLEVDGMNRAGV